MAFVDKTASMADAEAARDKKEAEVLTRQEVKLAIEALTAAHIDLRSAWRFFDKDNSGTISVQELYGGMQEVCPMGLSKASVGRLFEIVDEDGSGEIDKDEFFGVFEYLNRRHKEDLRSPPLEEHPMCCNLILRLYLGMATSMFLIATILKVLSAGWSNGSAVAANFLFMVTLVLFLHALFMIACVPGGLLKIQQCCSFFSSSARMQKYWDSTVEVSARQFQKTVKDRINLSDPELGAKPKPPAGDAWEQPTPPSGAALPAQDAFGARALGNSPDGPKNFKKKAPNPGKMLQALNQQQFEKWPWHVGQACQSCHMMFVDKGPCCRFCGAKREVGTSDDTCSTKSGGSTMSDNGMTAAMARRKTKAPPPERVIVVAPERSLRTGTKQPNSFYQKSFGRTGCPSAGANFETENPDGERSCGQLVPQDSPKPFIGSVAQLYGGASPKPRAARSVSMPPCEGEWQATRQSSKQRTKSKQRVNARAFERSTSAGGRSSQANSRRPTKSQQPSPHAW